MTWFCGRSILCPRRSCCSPDSCHIGLRGCPQCWEGETRRHTLEETRVYRADSPQTDARSPGARHADEGSLSAGQSHLVTCESGVSGRCWMVVPNSVDAKVTERKTLMLELRCVSTSKHPSSSNLAGQEQSRPWHWRQWTAAWGTTTLSSFTLSMPSGLAS